MLKRQWLAAAIIFTAFYWMAKSSRGVWENANPQLAIAWNTIAFLFLAFMIVCIVLMILEKEGW
jgi:hypothetical protein